MSVQHPEQVTFHDASACFSDDEWKLLHQWQKDLYRNVMKEIHQALISLGPLITSTVFSLRAKENQELVPRENQDSERRHGIHHSPSDVITNPDVLFRINREENVCLKNSQDTDGRAQSDCISTGFPLLNSDICLRKEAEAVSVFIDHLGMEVRDNSTTPISEHEVVPFHVKDEQETYCMDHQESRRIESISSPTGLGAFTPVTKSGMSYIYEEPEMSLKDQPITGGGQSRTFLSSGHADKSFVVKKEEHSNPVDQEDSLKKENSSSPTEDKVISFVIKEEYDPDPLDHQESEISERSSSPKVDQPNAGNKKGEDVHQCKECEKNFSRRRNLMLHQKIHTEDRPFSCTMCEKRFSLKKYLLRHQRIHSEERNFSCAACDLRCHSKSNLLRHQRVHMEERPFCCPQCDKRFPRKNAFVLHQKIHTIERPIFCTDCKKSFNHKSDLLKHRRMHTGEKNFSCKECEKSFARKETLGLHQRIHTGDIPFSCTECEKRFSHQSELLRHHRKHTRERPFLCAECEKSFSQKSDLLRHFRRMHSGNDNPADSQGVNTVNDPTTPVKEESPQATIQLTVQVI